MLFTKKDIGIIKEIAWADFKLKYSSSILGFFWSLLNPLLMLSVLFLVFSVLLKWEIENYQLFLLLGIVLWNFFVESTTRGMSGILDRAALIKKIYFKREILIIAACLTSFFTLMLNIVVFLGFMVIFKAKVRLPVLYFPIILAELFILSMGLSFGLSAFYTKYRDMQHIWVVVLNLGFFITPIIYPTSNVPADYLKLYMLNPMARIISDSREIFIAQHLPGLWPLAITVIMCLAIFFIGYLIFNKRKTHFAEEI